MPRRFAMQAWTIGLLVVSASTGLAQYPQQPIYQPGALAAGVRQPVTMMSRSGSEVPAVWAVPENRDTNPNSDIRPVIHQTNCDFDAYACHDEMIAKKRKTHLAKRYKEEGDCGCGDGCDFVCANCWGCIDFEKRFIWSFVNAGAQDVCTQFAYGAAYSGQFGIEALPFICSDADNYYSRWGMTTFFNYTYYAGNQNSILLDRTAGARTAVRAGQSYDAIFGPTYRVDFDILHVRVSPVIMAGVILDWSQVQLSAARNGGEILGIGPFKTSGFDVGGYGRFVLDFGITDAINMGVGMEYKLIPTDVMMDNGKTRMHFGLVLAVSHTF